VAGGGAGESVEVYRQGFGFYPEYDDAGGSVPSSPSYLTARQLDPQAP
jgi:hypothetical protein